jgi:hypothetical protein
MMMKSGPVPSPTPVVGPTIGFYARQTSAELEIVSCTATSVEVRGSQSTKLIAGTVLLYIQDGSGISCAKCSPLFRKISSVVTSASGTKILSTTFATVGEILGTLAGSAIKNDPIEPMAGCSHSSRRVDEAHSSESEASTEIAAQGDCKDSWLVKNPDGRCTHTNCFVGITGDPTNCFECMAQCDNGCGPASVPILNTDGNFGFFDFGPACCNHDHCWSSTRGKDVCDTEFYNQMRAQCAPLLSSPYAQLLLPVNPAAAVAPFAICEVMATFFSLASSFRSLLEVPLMMRKRSRQNTTSHQLVLPNVLPHKIQEAKAPQFSRLISLNQVEPSPWNMRCTLSLIGSTLIMKELAFSIPMVLCQGVVVPVLTFLAAAGSFWLRSLPRKVAQGGMFSLVVLSK